MNNLKKLQLDASSGSGKNSNSIPPPPSGTSRMQRDNLVNHNGPPPHPYGHFGHPMPMGLGSMGHIPPMGHMGSLGPSDHMQPMNAALAHYGGFPPLSAYGPPGPSYGHGLPPSAQLPPYTSHGGAPSFQGSAPARHGQPRPSSHSSARGSESQPSTALVLRRNDDSDIDPETKVWKDMFLKLFTGCFGWASSHCKEITPGAVEAATKNNPRLWDYILKVAACYKDVQAAPKHALFMLNSPEHRLHFISRLLLQYIEQEMLHWKFWLGWDDEVDLELHKIGPVIDYIGYPLEMRRDARHRLRSIVEGIVRDEEYGRFRSFKTSQHATRLKDIAGPFLGSNSSGSTSSTAAGASHDASVGLHSMANMGMELSNKMMTSRLSFAFTWNECAVKFCHDSHMALNSPLNGMALQHKHIRIALVVTPSVSYRDDTGPSIVPRGVTKAQVLVMN